MTRVLSHGRDDEGNGGKTVAGDNDVWTMFGYDYSSAGREGDKKRRDSRRLKGMWFTIVIHFLSKSEEETTANRKLAKELFDKWSRSLFGKKTCFGDKSNIEDEMTLRRPVKKLMIEGSGTSSCLYPLAFGGFSQVLNYSHSSSSSRQLKLRPEAMPMEFVVRPKSKVDPDEVRARARRMVPNQRHEKLSKKLEQMRASKRKQLQATKISVEGRGMVKYL